MDILISVPSDELQATPSVGPRIAESISAFFAEKHNRQILKDLEKAGLTLSTTGSTAQGTLTGKTFVLTGTLTSSTREEARQIIEGHGGSVTSSVSKRVNYVVVGEAPGSKRDRARALGIPIITEDELLNMIR
jgi:DNA ligase (NAD+)